MKERGEIMSPYENADIEYKEIYVADIKKEVVAFANTEGESSILEFGMMARLLAWSGRMRSCCR